MAWAQQLPSGKYRGRFRDGAGRVRSAGTWPTKRRALNEASRLESSERVSVTSADAERITWAEWEPVWLAARRVQASTLRHDRARIALHVRPRWGSVRLADISPHDVQVWLGELEDVAGLSGSSITKCFHLLSASLRAAVAARLLPSSPVAGVKPPKRDPVPERYLSAAEVDAICDGLSRHDELAVRLLVGTGIRLGEALGLHWEHVDLVRRVVTVRWSWDNVGRQMKPPKSYAQRAVPIGVDLARRLDAELGRRGSAGERPPVSYSAKIGLPASGLVLRPIRSIGGKHPDRPMDGQAFRDRWGDALSLAGVGGASVPHARIHDLRHTYASQMVRAGVPILAVKDLLGHQSVTTTERYSHLADSQWDAVRDVLDGPGGAASPDAPLAFAPRLRHGDSGRGA